MLLKKLCYLFFLLTLMGCSSDNEPIIDTPPNFISTATLSINGDAIPTNAFVNKTEDMFTLGVSKVIITFDKEGHLGTVNMNLDTGTPTLTSLFYSYIPFSSNYINFNLISLDEVNKRVKGTLSGYVYHNPFDLTSESKFINLAFDYEYIDFIPVIKDLKNHAKINGNQWKRSNKYMTKGTGISSSNITQHDVSDDEYKIMVNYNLGSIATGTYNFSANSDTNAIKLAKYDIASGNYIVYNCSGTLNITQKENLTNINTTGAFILSGNYNFLAVNPNNSADVITVTEGTFKLVYTYF